jgi:rSAM/selenodomain-associated transferase 1
MRMTICFMLKAPRSGEVKTRLGREIGFDEAERIYRRLVENQLEHLSGEELEVHYAPAEALDQMREWLGPSRCYVAQSAGGLGERLTHAMRAAFEQGAEAVLFLGGDCPDVTREIIDETEALLAIHDVVIGPAADGGYYLLAVKSCQPGLFQEIDWSTERVFRQTMTRIQELGLKSHTLPTFTDVDDLSSLNLARTLHPFLR